jgi:uncharacterized membrane protein
MQIIDSWVESLTNSGISGELATFILSAMPIVELRGGIPLGIGLYQLSPLVTYIFAVAGNLIPIFFITFFLRVCSKFLMKHSEFLNRYLTNYFNKIKSLHHGKFEKWGALALFLFVALPLPMTGAWTGTVAAFVFQIPLRYVFTFIPLGVAVAGGIMTLISIGVF